MADLLTGIRKNLQQVSESGRAIKRLVETGVLDLKDLGGTVQGAKLVKVYGPQATMAIQGGRRFPDLPAVVDERGTLTYKQVNDQSWALARGLKSLGVSAGSVVGILCRDHRGLVLAMAACGKLGARLVLMNTGFAKPQFAEVCKREGVRVVLHDSEFLGLLDALPADLPRILTWVDEGAELPEGAQTLDGIIAANSTEPLPPPSKAGGSVILTSGTTGLPKGAPRDTVSPLATAQIIDRIPFPRKGTMVIVSPIFHSTGWATYTVGAALGNKVVTARRFNAEGTLELIAKHKADMLVAVPTMLHRIVELGPEIIGKYDTSSLKVILIAGSALSPELSNRVQDTFGDVLYNMYGSTECAIASIATPAELRLAPGTAGRPPVTCEVVLYDENDQRIEGTNRRGRLFIRNGAPFQGYTDGRSKQIIDGYMSSGDMGHFDANGLLFVDGRDDDMIVSGGENVFPQEVENLLEERPDVAEAAVVGVDDVEFGKRLRAFIVSEPGAAHDAADIKQYVKDNLARHKVPRDVVFIDELPRNATGKLLRRVLVEMDVDT
ncbi:acyl-CoA synthetase [Mycolicibacterium wolinskyi]|uniref:Long-chain-fatty-acid--CoA ligase FadD13 n=1 Tax=Mycolicibacterium wolinskyi TaxID=59750 RepID=A0A1X2F5G0_9MYCO|nr:MULTISPECIES: acyl-CoA synthetase [Mycolicibacterium]MCV7289769.1 acyl-CoA synthetase [Mycolicibacterium wolinskyi]MCV7296366.1 acyl-CoA synthetase [Mycolicibacterium goodii]ORX13645.1 acyl-CoA synthetase [Mycolicibacterium wolinskyi]